MSVYGVNYFCYKQTRRLTECSVLAPTADRVSHCHSESTTVLLQYSSGANSVNSVPAMPQRRCIGQNLLVVQVCSAILSFQNTILTPQKFIYRQETKNFTLEQSDSASANHKGTWWVWKALMWFSPFYSWLPLLPSGRCNPQKIQAHLNESNFSISATCLLCCLIDLVPTREAQFFLGQCIVLKALSALPRGWALLGQKKELQCWSSWLKKYFS